MKNKAFLASMCCLFALFLIAGCGEVLKSDDDSPTVVYRSLHAIVNGTGLGTMEITPPDTVVTDEAVIVYLNGTLVTAEATNHSGCSFDWWIADFITGAACFETTATFVMDQNRTIEARFTP